MSLVFGGTTVNNVIFNGTTVDRIVFNGVDVYTSDIPDGYLYLNGRARRGWNVRARDNRGSILVSEPTNGLPLKYIEVNGYANIVADGTKPGCSLIVGDGRYTLLERYIAFDRNTKKLANNGFNINSTTNTKGVQADLTGSFHQDTYITITDIRYSL